jgi:hypothetical protein
MIPFLLFQDQFCRECTHCKRVAWRLAGWEVHGGITILIDKKVYKGAALIPHLLSPKVGESCSTANVLQKCYPIPLVLGPAYTPLPARRNEAFQMHTNVIHGSSVLCLSQFLCYLFPLVR